MSIKKSTGIFIGRFQVFELNEVHIALFNQIFEAHSKVVVFLGSNPAPSDQNPLDWIFRWKMLEEYFAEKMEVYEMPDLSDDRIWSQELDRRILELRPEGEVTLYGSEENFVERYSGRYKTSVMEAQDDDFEEDIITVDGVTSHRDFRAGVIYGTLRRFPTVYPTVDIAVFRNDFAEILLARKTNETKYRLPGGFTDPTDMSYEEAAIRELGEECGEIMVEDLMYIGSARINDWRYQDSMDTIMTHIFVCEFVGGEPTANDDIAEVRWFDVTRLTEDVFIPEHRVLFQYLEEFLSDSDDEDELDEDDIF